MLATSVNATDLETHVRDIDDTNDAIASLGKKLTILVDGDEFIFDRNKTAFVKTNEGIGGIISDENPQNSNNLFLYDILEAGDKEVKLLGWKFDYPISVVVKVDLDNDSAYNTIDKILKSGNTFLHYRAKQKQGEAKTFAFENMNKIRQRKRFLKESIPCGDGEIHIQGDATQCYEAVAKVLELWEAEFCAVGYVSTQGDIRSCNIEVTDITPPTISVSDEPYYKYLWHIDSRNSSKQKIVKELSDATGRESWTDNIDPHADINILEAWKITKGRGVKVAVIDDGGDVNHEDLKDNIFLAYNVDGQTDDIYHHSDSITDASHGNNCAGFIAAPINGKGIVGVAPESKLILIRQEEEADSASIEAFEYAKNNGAKVISCSWGTNAVSEAMIAELKSLYDAGVTVIFASGNEGLDLDEEGIEDESEVSWVIGVGASSELNDVTLYSNYGLNIDVIAPGGNSSTSIGILALDDSGEQGATSNYGAVSNDYAFTYGTSFSAPIVAGVVALMYSVNPNITPQKVRDILISTADKVGGDNADYWDEFDQQRAYGKINAFKAVKEAQNIQ